MSGGAVTRPRRLGRPLAFAGVAYAFAVTMLGTTLPTPLYPIYEREIGFSGLLVTIIYATYAVGVIAALLLFGQLSDQIGRRRTLLPGLVLSAASSVVFLVATGLPLLFVGRVLSGLSAGIFTGTATAAVIELAPEGGRRGTLTATAANIGGLGMGPLVAGVLAQWLPAPLRLPYALHLVLLVGAFAAVWLLPDPVEGRRRPRLRPQRLRVPAEMRATFVTAAIAGFAAFAVFGLFAAVAPAFLSQLLHEPSHLLAGVVVFVIFAASVVAQIGLAGVATRTALAAGCAGLMAGMGLVAAALAAGSLPLLLAGAVIGGLAHGLAFRAAVGSVTAESPPGRRAEVSSSLFVIFYVAISIPVIGVGVLAQAFGLLTAGVVFAVFVALLALAALAGTLARA